MEEGQLIPRTVLNEDAEFIGAGEAARHLLEKQRQGQSISKEEYRETIDVLMEAVNNFPSPWSSNRFIYLQYINMFFIEIDKSAEDPDNVRRSDTQFYKQIIGNVDHEPVLFRAFAASCLGNLRMMKKNPIDTGMATEAYESVGSTINTLTPEEAAREIDCIVGENNEHQITVTVRCFLNQLRQLVATNEVERTANMGNSSSVAISNEMRQIFYRAHGPVGNKCDNCGITREDAATNGDGLKNCRKCKLVFYCSRECQKLHWRSGHKEACRRPGQIEIGDVMLVNLKDDVGEQETRIAEIIFRLLDGRFAVKFIGPNLDGTGVETLPGTSTGSATLYVVEKEWLKHIKPN